MPKRTDIASILAVIVAVSLVSGCAISPRIHSASELASLADRCDVWPTELAQHRERPEIFYFLKPTASEPQFICVARWAKKNHLRLVYVESVEQAPETPEP